MTRNATTVNEAITPTTQAETVREGFAAGITRPLQWRREQLQQMDRLLAENGPAVEDALLADLGKPVLETLTTEIGSVRSEIHDALVHLEEWTAPREVAVADSMQPARASILRQPLGTVLVIAPWNYPVHLLLMPVVAAVAAGNAVVMKPSELAPETARLMAALVRRYLDPRAVRIVEGGVEETTELLQLGWDHIFYTGNGAVGRIVMSAAAKHLTPVTLELGGKSPVWVDESADIPRAAHWLAWGKFANTGQTCVAPDYVLTTLAVQEQLIGEIRREVAEMFGENPKASPDFGRIVNTRHTDRIAALIPASGVAIGGDVDREQRYIAPTVLSDVSVDDPVMQEEIFGPLLPIVTVAGLDEAIAIVNRRDKPLALYVFSGDEAVTERMLSETSSGSVAVNAVMMQLGVSALPFGGVGASGMGSYHGEHGVRTFSHERAVFDKVGDNGYESLTRPPYTSDKIAVLRGAPAGA